MNSKVRVSGTAAGNVVVVSENNPEWGYIRVEQNRITVDDNGFAKNKLISALVYGTVKDLKSFGWTKGQEIGGIIIAKDQLTPFNKTNPERDHKVAGKTGIICTVGGSPIYRKTFYKQDETAKDVYIQHDNADDIKIAALEQEQLEVAPEPVDSLQEG